MVSALGSGELEKFASSVGLTACSCARLTVPQQSQVALAFASAV